MRRILSAVLAAAFLTLVAAYDRQPGSAVPPVAPKAPPAGGTAVTGTVLETMDSGGYTYLKLKTASGEVWAAVPQAAVQVGQRVSLGGVSPMRGFTSNTLNRTFDEILFGTLASSPGAAPPGKPHGVAPAAPPPAVDLTKPIVRAEGDAGRTVAEVHAQRTGLKGKTVAVRGRVVKFLPGILGKNWLHLQDGSGTAQDGTNDLVVTTGGTAAVGDLVVARGTLGVDRDFGAGYAYTAILEDAAIEK